MGDHAVTEQGKEIHQYPEQGGSHVVTEQIKDQQLLSVVDSRQQTGYSGSSTTTPTNLSSSDCWLGFLAQGEEWNYITQTLPILKFWVPTEHLAEFWTSYAHLQYIRGNCPGETNLAERLMDTIPLLVELDGRENPEQYIPLIMDVFRQTLTITIGHDMSYLMMFDGNSFRVQWPFLGVKLEHVQNIIYPAIVQALHNSGFNHKGVINMRALNGPLPLLDSRREASSGTWQFVGMFRDGQKLGASIIDSLVNSSPIHQLGFLFSQYYPYQQLVLPKPVQARPRESILPGNVLAPDDHLEMACELLPMINRARFNNIREWKEIGQCLYACSDGSEKGLDLWCQYSPTGLLETARILYPSFYSTKFTIRTLGWLASKDNPTAYTHWHSCWIEPAAALAVNQSHTDISATLYRIYWLSYVCALASRNEWYIFNGNTWQPNDHGINIRKLISGDLLVHFSKFYAHCLEQAKNAPTKEQAALCQEDAIKYLNLISRLKNHRFKRDIYNESLEPFYDENFSRYLDSNANIIGLHNGILEAYEDQIIFRQGKPEDYVSIRSPVNYDPTMTWDHPRVKDCMHWMRQLFPNKELRDHFLKLTSSILRGRNSAKLLIIWLGKKGNNAKSVLIKLLEAILGTYCIKIDAKAFTHGGGSPSGPSPHLARLAFRRLVVAQELEENVSVKPSVIKWMTGGDTFYARMLHDNGRDIENYSKIIWVVNEVPTIPSNGQPLLDRIMIIPFESVWSKNAPATEEEQFAQRHFQIDPNFEDNIPDIASAFLWILGQYYTRYKREGLTVPKEVEEATHNYWKTHDPYNIFIEYRFNRTTGGVLTTNEVINYYQAWFRESYPTVRIPDPDVIFHGLISVLGAPTDGYWHNLRRVDIIHQSRGGSGQYIPSTTLGQGSQ